MPPDPKAPEQRARRNPHGFNLTVDHDADAVEAPPAKATWDELVAAAWAAYWRSPLVRVTLPTDVMGLFRLFDAYQEREELVRRLRRRRTVRGSTGQLVRHPDFARLEHVEEKVIPELERAYGANPLARLKLGIRLRDAAGGSDEPADDDAGDEPDDDAGTDPRLLVMDGGAR